MSFLSGKLQRTILSSLFFLLVMVLCFSSPSSTMSPVSSPASTVIPGLICEVSMAELEQKMNEAKNEVLFHETKLSQGDFINLWGELKKELESKDNLDGSRVKIQLSKTEGGLIIKPLFPGHYPILSYQHGTILEKRLAPSQFNLGQALKYPEVLMLSYIAVTRGYVVCMADYPGFGSDIRNQPYVIADAIADSVIQMINMTITEYKDWNNQLFLMGYSEGGYATMVAARKIQNNYPDLEAKVKAVAPLDGPYDLSGTMNNLMTSKKPYHSGFGYFLPMTMRSYFFWSSDPNDFSKENALQKKYWPLFDLVDGYHTIDEVEKQMPSDNIISEILTPAIKAKLKDKNSKVFKALSENNAYSNWNKIPPVKPMQLFHAPKDELVPYQNAKVAKEKLKLSLPIHDVKTLSLVPLPVHVKAVAPAMGAALKWFKKISL